MRSYLLLVVCFWTPVGLADVFEGTFEQIPWMDVESIQDTDLRARAKSKLEREKMTVVVSADRVELHSHGEVVVSSNYEVHGSTLVASEGKLFLVLFFEDEDTVRSTLITFSRVGE